MAKGRTWCFPGLKKKWWLRKDGAKWIMYPPNSRKNGTWLFNKPQAKWQGLSSWDFLPGRKIRASSDKIPSFPRGHYTCPAASREFTLGIDVIPIMQYLWRAVLAACCFSGKAQKRPRCSQMCSKANMPWWPVSPVRVTYLDFFCKGLGYWMKGDFHSGEK